MDDSSAVAADFLDKAIKLGIAAGEAVKDIPSQWETVQAWLQAGQSSGHPRRQDFHASLQERHAQILVGMNNLLKTN